MKNWWEDFWYEWIYPPSHLIRYGGGPQGHQQFRKQRLINILFALLIFVLFGWLKWF